MTGLYPLAMMTQAVRARPARVKKLDPPVQPLLGIYDEIARKEADVSGEFEIEN